MCGTNCNFEKFENTVNLIYTVCAILEMMMYTMFAMGSMMRITAVEISKKVTIFKTNCKLEKFENTVNPIYTVCAMSEMMI